MHDWIVFQIETVVNELKANSWSTVDELLNNHCTDQAVHDAVKQERLNHQQQLSKLTDTVAKLKV